MRLKSLLFKTLLFLLALFVLLIAACMLFCSNEPYAVTERKQSTTSQRYEIYVVSHGWHTGFVIPAQHIQSEVVELKHRFAGAQRIEFGWGDKGFYEASEITSGLTMKSLFWPTETVVHAVAVPGEVQDYFINSRVEKFCIDDAQYRALLEFITNSFYQNTNGELQGSIKGIYGDSQFYLGAGEYHFMNTCNKWTAKGLQSAGFDINPLFKLTSDSVMDFIAEEMKLNATWQCTADEPKPLMKSHGKDSNRL